MRPPRVQVALLTGILVVGMVPVTLVDTINQRPNATGGVATITALNRRTGMAALTAETGEVFVPPKDTRWPGGEGARCERVDFRLQRLDAAPRSQLRHCQPWQ